MSFIYLETILKSFLTILEDCVQGKEEIKKCVMENGKRKKIKKNIQVSFKLKTVFLHNGKIYT